MLQVNSNHPTAVQARTVHPYPTLGEAVQQCALNYNRARWAKLGAPAEAGPAVEIPKDGGVRKN